MMSIRRLAHAKVLIPLYQLTLELTRRASSVDFRKTVFAVGSNDWFVGLFAASLTVTSEPLRFPRKPQVLH